MSIGLARKGVSTPISGDTPIRPDAENDALDAWGVSSLGQRVRRTRAAGEERMRGTSPILVAAVISIAPAGCGGGSSTSSTKQSTPAPVASASHALPAGQLGTYVRPSSPSGTSTGLRLTTDGRYSQTVGDGSVVNGLWSFSAGKITFNETGPAQVAVCIGQRGTYRWAYANRKLTLTVVSDPCTARKGDFQAAPWRQRF